MIQVLKTSLEMGLIFAILSMGVLLTYKILGIADMSVEGTFPLGAFIFALAMIKGLNPAVGMILSFIGGLLAGLITFLLYRKLKVASLLAGILTMTILYSVNLRIVGKANVPLFNYQNLFTSIPYMNKMVILLVIVLILKIALDLFFKTEHGYMLVVTGDNESLVKSLGKKPNTYIMIGIMLSNGLVSLAGSLMAQYQNFSDSQMGSTIIVTALASIIIGDTFLKNNLKIKPTTRAIIGAIIYKLISGIAIEKGLEPTDLKMITAFIVIIFIMYNNISSKVVSRIKDEMRNKNVENK